MSIRYFPAVLEAVSDGFSVFFPDLPGCTSHGRTSEEAVANAEAALALHLRGMVEDKEAVPEPTPLERLELDPEVAAFATVLVRGELPGRSVRFNASFEEGLLAAVDSAAGRRGKTRSAFLADAARRVLQEESA